MTVARMENHIHCIYRTKYLRPARLTMSVPTSTSQTPPLGIRADLQRSRISAASGLPCPEPERSETKHFQHTLGTARIPETRSLRKWGEEAFTPTAGRGRTGTTSPPMTKAVKMNSPGRMRSSVSADRFLIFQKLPFKTLCEISSIIRGSPCPNTAVTVIPWRTMGRRMRREVTSGNGRMNRRTLSTEKKTRHRHLWDFGIRG